MRKYTLPTVAILSLGLLASPVGASTTQGMDSPYQNVAMQQVLVVKHPRHHHMHARTYPYYAHRHHHHGCVIRNGVTVWL